MNWSLVPLASIAEVKLGRQRSPQNHIGPTMRKYLRAGNVGWSGLILDDVKSMNFTDAELDNFRLEPGDILLSEASGSPTEVGKPAIWNGEIEDCAFQNTLLRVRSGPRIAPQYLLHYFRHQAAIAAFARGSRGVGINHLGREALAKWPVPHPALDEQHRVAAILDRADALRAKKREVLSMLDDLEQAAFLQLFGAPSTWPKRWKMGTIGEMAAEVQYGTAAKAGSAGAWPIIRMGNVTDTGRLNLTDLKWIDLTESEVARFTVQRGDLLFNRTNSREKVGKTCVVETDDPLAFAGYLVRVRLKHEHRPAFVNAFMTSSYGRALRFGIAKAAVNQANISATEMRSIPIALPPQEVQNEFSDVVVKISPEREKQKRALTELDGLFASLQARAFSGQL